MFRNILTNKTFRVTSINCGAGPLFPLVAFRSRPSLTTSTIIQSESSCREPDRTRLKCIQSLPLFRDPKGSLHDLLQKMGRKKTDFLKFLKNLSSPPSFFPSLLIKKMIYSLYLHYLKVGIASQNCDSDTKKGCIVLSQLLRLSYLKITKVTQ